MKKTRWIDRITYVLILASYAYFLLTLRQAGVTDVIAAHYTLLPLILVIALIVQFIKATRMYIIMIDTNLSYADSLRRYAETTIINIVVPFKIGEIYRIFLYGSIIGSYTGGAVRVLTDRLVDTAALLTCLTVLLILKGTDILPLYLFLLAVFIVLMVVWLAFPSIYRFWNDYLVSQKHSARAVGALKMLSDANNAYQYLRKLIHGRIFVMYVLSMLAWGLELIGVYALTSFHHTNVSSQIAAYLNSTLTAVDSEHQKLYAAMLLFAVILKRRRAAK
jgi:hypothetical protein